MYELGYRTFIMERDVYVPKVIGKNRFIAKIFSF